MSKKMLLLIIVAAFGIGYFCGYSSKSCQQGVIVNGAAGAVQNTTISYVPKAAGEKTDVEANIGKPAIAVKVNGKNYEFEKQDNEKTVFDKNKLRLDQETKVAFEIRTEQIDNTRRWGLGALYDSNNELNGVLMFPAVKLFSFPVNGIVAAGRHNVGAGLLIMIK